MTIGRNRPSRRRIMSPPFRYSNYHSQSRESRRGSRQSVAGVRWLHHYHATPAPRLSLHKEAAELSDRRQHSIRGRSSAALTSPSKIHYSAFDFQFELLFRKVVTKQKRWATTQSSGSPLGDSLVVRVSGGTLARISGVAPYNSKKSNHSGK